MKKAAARGMPRRAKPDAGATTRDRIVTAARELFYEKGYHATGLAEILARADARSGSFYHYFESKEDLLRAVLDQYTGMLHPVLLAPIYEAVTDPVERIFALLGRYREAVIRTGFAYACPIGRIAFEVEPEMAIVHERVAANFRAWSKAVADNLRAAQGFLPADVDPDHLAVFVLTTMEGGVMQARSFKSIEPFDQSVAMLRDYFNRLRASAVSPAGRRSRGGN